MKAFARRFKVAFAFLGVSLSCAGPEFTPGGSGGASGQGGQGGQAGSVAGASQAGAGGLAWAGSGACDWNDQACVVQTCPTLCPPDMGSYCLDDCTALIQCLQQNPGCGEPGDPMCIQRVNGQADVCTEIWEHAGSGMKDAMIDSPSLVAKRVFECACRVR